MLCGKSVARVFIVEIKSEERTRKAIIGAQNPTV